MTLPDSSISRTLQDAKAAIEFVENSSAKGVEGIDLDSLQQYAEGLRNLQRSLNLLPQVIITLRGEVHSARMAIQSSVQEK